MNCRILTTSDSEEWSSVLRRLPGTDVYFTAEYHHAHEAGIDGRAFAFVAEQGDRMLFHCFFLRPIRCVGTVDISGGLQDIETVYGYTGPVAVGNDPEFLSRAWDAFADWGRGQSVVAEFVRFNPVLGNAQSAGSRLRITADRETVLLSIAATTGALWKSYPSTQRNMVRKALSKGLACEELPARENLEVFIPLYEATMRRAGAAPSYFFSCEYYNRLCVGLGDRLRLFVVSHAGEIAAAALTLVSEEGIDYHLAASSARFRDAAPNNLLLHTIAEWACERGLRWFHLGGGRTPVPDDDLLRFKSSISKERRTFHIGRRVHDAAAYERLCKDWMKQEDLSEPPPYFLLYRLRGKSHENG